MEKLSSSMKKFYGFFLETMSGYGLSSVQSKIAALLHTTYEPLALDEIAARTGYSLASISSAIKVMEKFKMVKTSRHPGSKKLYVELKRELATLMREKIDLMRESEIIPLKSELPEWIKELKEDVKSAKKSDVEPYKEQLHILKNHYEQITMLDEVFDDILKAFAKREKK